MQTIEYRTIDKTAWGDGPWLNEPDKKQWQDVETGLPCLAVTVDGKKQHALRLIGGSPYKLQFVSGWQSENR